MTEVQTANNGIQAAIKPRRGKPKQWKDLTTDPLAEGFDEHHASYIIGRTPITWSQLGTGALFSRSKSGKALHVKLDSGRAICLDTGASIEVAPRIRLSLQVWQVTSINTTTATKP